MTTHNKTRVEAIARALAILDNRNPDDDWRLMDCGAFLDAACSDENAKIYTRYIDQAKAILNADPLTRLLGPTAINALLAGEAAVVPLDFAGRRLDQIIYMKDDMPDTYISINDVRIDKPQGDNP